MKPHPAHQADDPLERQLQAIAGDRVHGAGYLARKALGVLLLVTPESKLAVAARLAQLRPEMPAIKLAIAEALAEGDVRQVIRRCDAERRRVARSAMRSLARRRVVTISNSSLVSRALVYANPSQVQVVVDGPEDEGHLLVADLGAAGISATAVRLQEADGEIAVVGCDAVFDDGTFVNRKGTRALVERFPTLVLVDRWKRIGGPAPDAWLLPCLFELVPGERVRAPA